MIKIILRKFALCVFSCFLQLVSFQAQTEELGKIVAIVEEDVILDDDLRKEVNAIAQRIQAGNAQLPPESVLRRQVLEKMIIEKLQFQFAEKAGIDVNEEQLKTAANDIAQRNNMSLDQFRDELGRQGISYNSFLDSIRNEIILNQLRGREIGGRIKVTDKEVEHFMETEDKFGEASTEYRIGHILIAVPEAATSSAIQNAQTKADDLVAKLRSGADFNQTAISFSDSGNALKGGDLGWRRISDIPTLFAGPVGKMEIGEVVDPIRSPSGFHIIKLLDKKGVEQHSITKTKVRHILIKTNDLIDDAEARKRLLALRERVVNGEDFAELARSHSDDKGSALKGGGLDWVGPGDLVKAFEETMEKLAVNEISQPVQTQFGWHLIQVLGREEKDNSSEYAKNVVRDAIRKRKIEEETELWLRRMRDEAYIEIFTDRL